MTAAIIAAILFTSYPNTGLLRVEAASGQSLQDFEEELDYTSRVQSYKKYLDNLRDQNRPDAVYEIPADQYSTYEGMEVRKEENYEGMPGTSIYVEESGMLEYEVLIDKSGLYQLALIYYPVEGKSAAIQRSFFVDGKLPYKELSLIEFQRVWINESDTWKVDNKGNDLRPVQVEAPEWIQSNCYDLEGYISEPLSIYLTEGKHTISIVSRREPMVLNKLVLYNDAPVITYAEKIEKEEKEGALNAPKETLIEIQAEYATKKSSQMLYPQHDQSSPSVYPYSAKVLKNNSIGGETSWNMSGQWIEWEFEVPEDGCYNITLRAKQNFVKGTNVSRKITIDGKVPFEEMNSYAFKYNSGWTMNTLSSKEGEAYRFYLEKGNHTIRMEVNLGQLADIIGEVQEIMSELNAIYRKVIRITGVSPDTYRDYQIEKSIPELAGQLSVCEKRLNVVIDSLREIAGAGSDKETSLINMRDQLKKLAKDVENISKNLGGFKTNISALGTWITLIIKQPLMLDAIYVSAPDTKLPKLKESFIQKLFHELKKLIYSYIVDYNSIGNVAEEGKESTTITVWVGTGRDQANVIKSLVDESFTKNTNINVNVQLVDMNTLLQATVSGQGPDVALSVNNDLPMNYGLRNAALDLTEIADEVKLKEVLGWFRDSALLPLYYEGALYGLPETQTCQVMFYRKDILKELGLEIPKTWDEIKTAMSVLNENQMSLGMQPVEQTWVSLLYQNGGDYYTKDAVKSALDSDEAIKTFIEFTEYYTDYKLDRETSLEQGFRTGEMPIIITDFSTYNNFQVSAPDIKGLWGFTSLPGTVRKDGSIVNTSAGSGVACMIMKNADDKDAAWEFLQWWVSADVQTAYGRELESLMGAAARYPSANIEAFKNLPWPVQDYEALEEQFKQVRGIPQVPGGYYTWRNVNNAFYRVVLAADKKRMVPREALMEYVKYINDEITYKRTEFGMTTAE